MEKAEQKNISGLRSQVSRAEVRVAQAKSSTEKEKAREKLIILRGRLAWLYLANKDYDKARAQYKKMPRHHELRYYGMSCIYLQCDMFEEADKCIDQGLSMYPNSCLLRSSRGIFYMHMKEHYLALDCFDHALALDPATETGVIPNKAHVLDEIGYLHEAGHAWKRAVELYPHSGEYEFYQAHCALKLEEYSAAAEGCREAIRKGFNNSGVYEVLCKCYLNFDQLDECEATAIEALREYPEERPMLYWYAGYPLASRGRYDEALEMMEKAVQLAPDDDFFKRCSVSFQGWKEDAEKAAQQMQEAAASDDLPNKSAAGDSITAADAFLVKGDYARAVREYEAVPLNERTKQWYICITQALIEEKKFGQAEMMLEEAIAAFPNSYCILNNMGMRYYRDSKYKKAISFFDQAIAALSGENAKKKEKQLLSGALIAYFNKALCLVELGRYQKAIDIYEQLIAIDPADASYHYELGHAYYCAQKTWLSIGHHRLAYDLGLRTAGVYGGLCCAYIAAGFTELALHIAAEGLEKHPDVEGMYENAAETRLESDELKKALAILKQGLKRFPESAALKKLLSRAEEETRKSGEGLRQISRDAGKAPQSTKQNKLASSCCPGVCR